MHRFSAAEDEQLIKIVSGFPILWNIHCQDYKNSGKKDLLWANVGKMMNKRKDVCQRRWRSIRDHYRRQFNLPAGSGVKKKRAFYWDRLTFLDSVQDETDNVSNVPSEEVQLAEESNEADPITDVDTSGVSSKPELQPSPNTSATLSPSKKRRENDSPLKYSDGKQDRAHTCFRELVQDPQEDEIDMFFRTMAMTVKKFPPRLVTETKLKVFQTVADMEIKLQQQCTACTSSNNDAKFLRQSSSSCRQSNTSLDNLNAD